MTEFNTSPNEFNPTTIPSGPVPGPGATYDVSVVNGDYMQGILPKGYTITTTPTPPPPPPPPPGGTVSYLTLGPAGALSVGNPIYKPQIWNNIATTLRIELLDLPPDEWPSNRITSFTGKVYLTYYLGAGVSVFGPSEVLLTNGISPNFNIQPTLTIGLNQAYIFIKAGFPDAPAGTRFIDATGRWRTDNTPNQIAISVTR